MSLGWQTESALLPSRAKKISVDGTSMLSLHAVILEKEQKRQGLGEKCERYRRRGDIQQENKSLRNIFHGTNKGISGRNSSDLKGTEGTETERVQSSLMAKSDLYDRIASGQDPLLSSATATLIDFRRKRDREEDEYTEERGLAPPEDSFRLEYEEQRRLQQQLGSYTTGAMSSSARVKSQWERNALSMEAKSYLTDHLLPPRKVEPTVTSAKESRRDLILKKQQEHGIGAP